MWQCIIVWGYSSQINNNTIIITVNFHSSYFQMHAWTLKWNRLRAFQNNIYDCELLCVRNSVFWLNGIVKWIIKSKIEMIVKKHCVFCSFQLPRGDMRASVSRAMHKDGRSASEGAETCLSHKFRGHRPCMQVWNRLLSTIK